MAMGAEASSLLVSLQAVAVHGAPPLSVKWFSAQRHGAELMIALNGRDRRFGVDSIGTDAAVLNTYAVIERFHPDIVISAGTAGGWRRSGGEIGDVYVSDRHVVHHDRRIDLAGFSEYGIGRHPVVSLRNMAAQLGLKIGVVTTGNSLDESEPDRRMILASGAVVKDMEAASVAYVCHQMSVPFVAVKAITDLVDDHTSTADQFNANLVMASRRLSDELLRVVDWVIPRELAELD
jgi:5'-methylthioadenosine/S-adenosylhomocysteine nucleosidase